MNSAPICSEINEVNGEMKAGRGAELLSAASKGCGHEVVQILEADPDLLCVGDLVGDTAFHLFARAGNVQAIIQVIEFLQDEHPKLLTTVSEQQNGDGDTPLLLAAKNNHKEVVSKLSKVDSNAGEFVYHQGYSTDIAMKRRRANEQQLYENNNTILVMLEANPSLIHRKYEMGNTILHKSASFCKTNMLTKLVTLVTTYWSHCDSQLQFTKLNELLMDKNSDGDTALHLALERRHEPTARYLVEVVPETVYQVNHKGVSPLYLALKYGYHELIKYAFQLMPTTSISRSTIERLLSAKKKSVPHAAVKARNLMMLQLILERMPSLIDTPDEKGWKPLSYAAYKGYVEEVGYLLNKFPESAEKFDRDGSFPIHKAISGGDIDTIKEFISSHPKSLHVVDMKGRSVLHIAVRYAKADILAYLTQDANSIQNISELRDNDGKTFLDLAKELKRN